MSDEDSVRSAAERDIDCQRRSKRARAQRQASNRAQPAFSLEIGDASAWKEEGVREAAAAAVEALHEQASTNAFRSLDCPFCLS